MHNSGESFIQKRETFANTNLHATTTAAAHAINMTHFSRTERAAINVLSWRALSALLPSLVVTEKYWLS